VTCLASADVRRPRRARCSADVTAALPRCGTVGRPTSVDPRPDTERVPLSDAEIRAATIGELKPLDSPILLADYDPDWPRLFEREAARIRRALGGRALRIEHVGSTSVPGIAAKPIIDIVLVVADSADEQAYVPPLEAAGYVLRIREPEWFEHRVFKGPDTNVNPARLHEWVRRDRAHGGLPRLAAPQRRRPRALRAKQARARAAQVEVRPELCRRQRPRSWRRSSRGRSAAKVASARRLA
jgi:GrpB-like predicted nucleotidyltransferase (UPF0157 family)